MIIPIENLNNFIKNPIVCDCGNQLEYNDGLDMYICDNPDCINNRVNSVLSTLRALDRQANLNGMQSNLVELAKEDIRSLKKFIQICNIKQGGELITCGKSFSTLGKLGQQLSDIIDNIPFQVCELSGACGSKLLDKFTIDFSQLTSDQRSIAAINNQLGIDGSFWLGNVLFQEYLAYRQLVYDLADYLILIRPAKKKRDTQEVLLSVNNNTSTVVNSASTDNLIETVTAQVTPMLEEINLDEIEIDLEVENNILEDLDQW